MDKHERPYKCSDEACARIPGFTYSGGLLRHEREVHGKHGGPKNSFNCPYANCKRHTGKGFSRHENLNEHLRRVHLQNGVVPGLDSPAENGVLENGTAADTDEAGSEVAPLMQKRKRGDSGEGDETLLAEVKRLRRENEELRVQIAGQNQQIVHMMQQNGQLHATADGHGPAPAPML